MFSRLVIPLLISISIAFAAAAPVKISLTAATEISLDLNLIKPLKDHEQQYELISHPFILLGKLEDLEGSNEWIQRLVLNQNVIINPTLDFIYFAQPPPSIS